MITREQVADLQPGDVVRVTGWQGLTVEGPVSKSVTSDNLWLGEYLRLSYEGADLPNWMLRGDATLTVVSRAPRPLYVNHPRTASVPGDVVRDADNDWDRRTWMFHNNGKGPCWLRVVAPKNGSPIIDARERREHLPPHLRLLVDGETGQVVQ